MQKGQNLEKKTQKKFKSRRIKHRKAKVYNDILFLPAF